MTDIPAIFSKAMVLALLQEAREPGTGKHMTRRLAWRLRDVGDNHTRVATPWQRVKPGDKLWVREAIAARIDDEDTTPSKKRHYAKYRADMADDARPDDWMDFHNYPSKWSPSIHMPRAFSRITIVVDAVKIEPLQAITEEDAAAEGIVTIPRSVRLHGRLDGYGAPGTSPEDASTTRVNAFRRLWQSLHGSESWDSNPEVVCTSGKVIAKNIDKVAA